MSANDPVEASSRHGGHGYRNPAAGIGSYVVRDRTWIPSRGITFQRPSQARSSTWSPTRGIDTSTLEPSASSSDRTTHSFPFAPSSNSSTVGDSTNLHRSGQFSNPDLSLASSTPVNDEVFYSSSNSSVASLWNESSQMEDAKTTSIAEGGLAQPAPMSDEPFRSPHGFHVPASKLQNALDSKAGSAPSYWQYTLYRGPEGEKDKVKLHYCKTKEATEAISQLFLDEEVIGLDIEWIRQAKSTDGIKKNVALIQIACEERIALFHLARFSGVETAEDFVAPTFKRIMESTNITKVGVAIKGDCTRIKNFLGIQCQGLFELSHLHKLVKYCSGNIDKVDRRYVRLADQVLEHLKLPLLKGAVQTSDWGRDLDFQQTQYAASDSYAGLQLFHVLEAKRKSFDPAPPRPAHAELNLAISLGDQDRAIESVGVLDDKDEPYDTESISSSNISVEELAREYFHVSLRGNGQVKRTVANEAAPTSYEAQILQTASEPPSSESPTVLKAQVHSNQTINSPKLEIANRFVAAFKPPPNRRIAPQALRAYSLWHEQGLSIPQVATMLRQPPIQNRTVINYLCDAISMGKLKCEPANIVGFSSEYSFQPVIKAHKDLFEQARKELWKAEVMEARWASKENGPRRT